MSLRVQAEADLGLTMEASGDFGWPFVLTDPDDFESASQLYGQAHRISDLVDPDTGQAVSGRKATLVVRTSTIVAAGYPTLPEGIADEAGKPWRVAYAGPQAASQVFKVSDSKPDEALGTLALMLETWDGVA